MKAGEIKRVDDYICVPLYIKQTQLPGIEDLLKNSRDVPRSILITCKLTKFSCFAERQRWLEKFKPRYELVGVGFGGMEGIQCD